MSDAVGRRVRTVAGLLVLAELVVFVLVAQWIGVGWTILATLATSVLGWMLLARQGTRALAELRERARTRRSPGAELGNAGLVAAGGLLMVLPGFIGDVIGLLCLLPGTRNLVRGGLTRLVAARLPVGLRPPVRVESVRTAEVPRADDARTERSGSTRLVIEGEIVRDPDGRPLT
ncbi:MAG TPA: FxsA family protein [Blastococcus sp.]|nr:FxsA family protein [Blastococcus sp.]